MKRKVLTVGKSSLAISLPKSFVRSNSISTGEEIDVIHRGSSLIVTAETSTTVSKVIDLSALSNTIHAEKILEKVLSAVFKQGVDAVKIILPSSEHVQMLRRVMRSGKLQMYEDPDMESSNVIKIRSPMKKFDEGSVDKMIEAIIKQVYVIFDEFMSDLKAGELSLGIVEKITAQDRLINDQTDICKRIINRCVSDYKSTSMYAFIDKIEKMADTLKELMEYSFRHSSSAKRYIPLMENICDVIYCLFTSYNKFSVKKINEFYDISSKINSIEPGTDLFLYYYCRMTVRISRSAYSNLMVMKL